MSDRTDFAPLGDIEIEGAGDIFQACELIRVISSTAGLIVLQLAQDVQLALQSIPVVDAGGWGGIGADNPQKRARRVARHMQRSAEALRTAAESAAKLPPAYLRTYNDVITTRRNRKSFDPKAGL
jgi:hypothetical protein